MAYERLTGQRCLATGRCHFDRENSKEHGELISNIIFRGIAMIYTVKRIEDDVFIFITYHKEESQDEKNYVDGKPDYADAFEDDLIFKWDSQIGKGLDSSYMKDVLEAERKHLLVKKSDAETSFYYMGQFTVVEARNARKEDNRGRMQPITKVMMKMQHPVREDLLRYLQSNITA